MALNRVIWITVNQHHHRKREQIKMTDDKLIHIIRRLLAAEDKPNDLIPLDLLQTIRFLLQHADEKDIYPSQETLAEELCSSADAIARSQKRLHRTGWIVVRKGGYRGRTNRYTVQLEKLPVGDLRRTVVSPDAKRIALQYGQNVKVMTRKKFMRNWLQQWSFQVQKLIDRTGGDAKTVSDIINFALRHPGHYKSAMRGPSELRKRWSVLRAEYEKHARAQTAPKTVIQAQSAANASRKPSSNHGMPIQGDEATKHKPEQHDLKASMDDAIEEMLGLD
jgi:hypothetical protein